MSISPRKALAATMIAGLLLAGCAKHQDTRRPEPSSTGPSPGTLPAAGTHREHAAADSTHYERAAGDRTTTSDAGLPAHTGIAACDDYLSSYLACHRAAGIFVPGQLQSRYEAMRASLLRDSQNPEIRPELAERCNSLASSLRQALHGKSCAENPASSASSP